MPTGVRLRGQELREVLDLYRWGARMVDIRMAYNYSRDTITRAVRKAGVPVRCAHAPTLANPKPHPDTKTVTSSRPTIPVGAKIVSDRPTPDQLLRSSAHALRDMRIAKRLSDGNRDFYLEEASECRYAFLRTYNRLPDLE